MNRDEFMKELEYLLMDIPDEDKMDAIEYYRDYLEEAGPDREKEAIQEFGSPERIAAIIRSDISGNLKEGGEFTDKGYEDERFKDPNYQMAKRYDLPEPSAAVEKEDLKDRREKRGYKNQSGVNQAVKILLWILLLIAASPILVGLGGGALGLFAGFLSCVAALVIALFAVTAVLLLAGVVALFFGIITIVLEPMSGILVLGLGIMILGLGILCIAACWVFYGKFLPFLFRGMVNAISNLLYRRRGRS